MADEKLVNILAVHQISPIEWHLLAQTNYLPKSPQVLTKMASRESHTNDDGNFSVPEFSQALEKCIRRNLLRVMTQADLDEIHERLNERPGIGPLYGLPKVGDIDFTTTGADTFSSIRESRRADHPWSHRWAKEIDPHDPALTHIYAYDELTAGNQIFYGALTRQNTVIVNVQPVGQWYRYWWDGYEKGYRISMKYGDQVMH